MTSSKLIVVSIESKLAIVVCTFDPSTREGRGQERLPEAASKDNIPEQFLDKLLQIGKRSGTNA